MKVNPKHILISAALMSILSMIVQGMLLFQNSPSNGRVPHANSQSLKSKSTDNLTEGISEASNKSIQDQKTADVNKILAILGETQNLVSGKKNLNPNLIKSFEKLSGDLDMVLKPYNLEDIKTLPSVKNQTDILKLGAFVEQLLKNLSAAGNGLSSLNSLSPSANSFTNSNSFFDLQRITKDSPLRKISEIFQYYAKNVDAVQKNAFDLDAMQGLQRVLAEGVDQISYLDSKYDSFNSQVKETINNLRQTPWPVKTAQLNADLQTYIDSLRSLNKVLEDKGNLKKASETLDTTFPKKLIPPLLGNTKSKEESDALQNSSEGSNIKMLVGILDEVKKEIGNSKTYSNQSFQTLNKLAAELREVLNVSSNTESVNVDLNKSLRVPKNQADIIENAKAVLHVLEMTINLEKSLSNLASLGSTASIVTAPNAFLDIQKIPVESPIRSLALSFDEAQKANVVWQKNIFDINAIAGFLTALTHTNEQFSLAEAAINPQSPIIEEAIVRLRQIAWQNKSQDAKQTLIQLKDQLGFLRKQLLDIDKVFSVANGDFSTHSWGGFGSGRVLQSLPFSMEIVIFLCLLTVLWINIRTPKIIPEDQLNNEEPLEKRTPYIAVPSEKKTNELIPELHQQVDGLEQKFIQSYQSSEKVLSYLQEVMIQVGELRTVHLTDDSGPSYLHIDVSKPLEDIDAALLSLKQIGIRLFLSILSNQSTRQLALETEQMNSLVEKTEATFADVKNLVMQVNQKAIPKRHSSDQAGMDLIELDLNQVLKEVKHWQDELTQMNQAIMSLNTLVGQYV
jgi:hypothetical protein